MIIKCCNIDKPFWKMFETCVISLIGDFMAEVGLRESLETSMTVSFRLVNTRSMSRSTGPRFVVPALRSSPGLLSSFQIR